MMVLEQSKTKWIPLQNVHWPLSEPAEKIARPCAKKKKNLTPLMPTVSGCKIFSNVFTN